MPTLEKFLKQAQEHTKKGKIALGAKSEMDRCTLDFMAWFTQYDALRKPLTNEDKFQEDIARIKATFGKLLTRQFRAIYAMGFTVQECLEAAEENNMEED